MSYFRIPEFSEVMLENEKLMLKYAKASEESKIALMTSFSTSSMEAVVMNCFTHEDKIIAHSCYRINQFQKKADDYINR